MTTEIEPHIEAFSPDPQSGASSERWDRVPTGSRSTECHLGILEVAQLFLVVTLELLSKR